MKSSLLAPRSTRDTSSRGASANFSRAERSVSVDLPIPLDRADPGAYRVSKRALDVTIAAVGIILASPLMLAIALCIKLASPGPIFFGHARLTRGGKLFHCLKFRSMRYDAHERLTSDRRLKQLYVANDYKIPLELDPRITRFGRFLRKTSLDELPQLFNVLAGSMSLVGPRPIVPEELAWYGEQGSVFLAVKPGITGEWQVQGRSRIPYPDRTRVELKAIERRSFWNDIKVLLRSIPAVIAARGSL